MRCSKLFLVLLFAVAWTLFASAPLSATVINTTTSTVLHYDNFEDTDPVSTIGAWDSSGSYNPTSANPGSWNIMEVYPASVQVTDYVDPVIGATPQGTKYLRSRQNGQENPDGYNSAAVMIFPQQTVIGQHIHIEEMVNMGASGSNQGNVLVGRDGGSFGAGIWGSRFIWLQQNDVSNPAGTLSYYDPTLGRVNLTTTYTPNAWEKWQLDFDVAATTTGQFLTLKVGGQASEQVPMLSWNPNNPDPVTPGFFGMDPGRSKTSPMYMDEVQVPEPGTFTLLAAGLLSLLCYAWRRRR